MMYFNYVLTHYKESWRPTKSKYNLPNGNWCSSGACKIRQYYSNCTLDIMQYSKMVCFKKLFRCFFFHHSFFYIYILNWIFSTIVPFINLENRSKFQFSLIYELYTLYKNRNWFPSSYVELDFWRKNCIKQNMHI